METQKLLYSSGYLKAVWVGRAGRMYNLHGLDTAGGSGRLVTAIGYSPAYLTAEIIISAVVSGAHQI